MDVEHFMLAALGSLAYELLFWKELLAKDIVGGKSKIQFRAAYLIIASLWIPVCALLTVYLFEDDVEKAANFIIIGFGMPSVLKTISSKTTAELGGRNLGARDAFTSAAKRFFRIGATI